ncbi:DUF6443 domain-containing protein, partial [Fulvivirga imtechensis]|uniref:DUF6443 domain-containing protein n=1 Tax=Fulvivirga imtechensis TaxID=881893 RepID=UPI0016132FDB
MRSLLFTFALLVAFQTVFSQSIQGPSSSQVGATATYSYTASHLTLGFWKAVGGTVVNTYSNGTTTIYADIQWNDAGSKSVRLEQWNGTLYDQKSVSVQLDPGSIGGAQTICYNGNASLTNTESADGGSSSIVYRWFSRPEDQSTFSMDIYATAPTLNVDNLTKTTYFKRGARLSGDTQYYFTNQVKITVRPSLSPGSISGAQTICNGGNPGNIYNSTSPSGGNGSYTYAWRHRSPGGSWSWISGANSSSYDPPVLTSTKEYQRRVYSCGQYKYSNIITITVRDQLLAGQISAQDPELCYGQGTGILSTVNASGGGGIQSYKWWRKIGSQAWEVVSDMTGAGYIGDTPGPSVQYKRDAISNNCGTVTSNTITITRLDPVSAGSISGYQTICSGTAPARLNNSASPSGGDGTYTYQWESAPQGGTYTAIAGATNAYYDPPVLSSNKWFRRKASSCGGTAISSGVLIEVYAPVMPGEIYTSEDMLCEGADPQTITSTAAASGGNGSYSYQWQSSTNGGSTWGNISGATGTSYNPPVLSATTKFRRMAGSGNCVLQPSNVVTLAPVLTVPDPVTLTGTYEFYQGGQVNLNFTTPPNANTYKWMKYNNGIWSEMTGVTSPMTETAVDGMKYKVIASNPCGSAESNIIEVKILHDADFLAVSDQYWELATGTITIQNYTGKIDTWQVRDAGGSWTNIAGSADTYSQTFTNKTTSFEYRVKVNGVASNPFTFEVHHTFADLRVTGPEITANTSVTVSLTGYQTATVTQWQYSEPVSGLHLEPLLSDDGFWIFREYNTSTSITHDNIVKDTYFRAKISLNGKDYFSPWKLVKKASPTDALLPEKLHTKTEQLREEVTDEANITAQTDKVTAFSYHDGLGRNVQSVVKGMSPGQNDMVAFQQYDEYGRVTRQYLPHTASGADFYTDPQTTQASFYNGAVANVPADSYPWAETQYDTSPLQRVLEQGAPGADWQLGSGHTVKQDITYNTAGTVRYWKPDGTTNSYYATNTLVISDMTDENGNHVLTCTDSRGLTISKKVQNDTGYLETYHIYDDQGKLKYTLPPKAVEILGTGTTLDANSASIAELIFKYTYDAKGRLVEKKVPGKAVEYIVYDPFDRPVLTQDGNLRASNQWYFTKYDIQQRPVYNGIYTNATQTTRATVQALFDNLDYETAPYYEAKAVNATYHGYSNTVFPTSGLEVLAVNYYDNYDFDRNGTADYAYDNTHLAGQKATNTLLRGMSTGSKTKILGTNDWLVNVVFYDDYGRAIQTLSNNHKNLAVADKATMVYKFNGEVEKVKNTMSQGGEILAQETRFGYDHAGRPVDIWHSTAVKATWVDLVNVTTENGVLSKTSGGQNWNGGGASLQTIPAGSDGSIEFVVNRIDTYRMIGLSTSNVDAGWANINYTFNLRDNGTFHIRESGSGNLLATAPSYESGDRFRIERKGESILYWHNNTLLRTVVANNDILLVDFSIFSPGHVLEEVMISTTGEMLLAHYQYNELGQLVKKDLHITSGSALQSVDYAYNIRGWLKSINDPDNITADKLFGMELLYNESLDALGQTPAYNGNITAMKWKNNLTTESEIQAYAYSYDKTDRLKGSNYGEGTGLTLGAQRYALSNLAYDANGNITGMTRKAPDATGLPVTIDQLTYNYSGNQLTKVDDTGNTDGFSDVTATTDYTYDSNGNTISDANKGITTITYNILNKPDSITFANSTSIKYIYDASGAKLSQKLYKNGTLQTTTDYIGNMVYENDTLQFFGHAEGRVVAGAEGGFDYQYAYSDHLGNVRMLYTANADSHTFTATMETEANEQEDDGLFTNVDETNTVDTGATSYNEVSRLFSSQPIGPGISLPMYPGDKATMSVKAYHRGGSDFNNTIDLNTFITTLAGIFGGVNGGTSSEQATFNAFDNAINPDNGGFGLLGSTLNTRPAGYLNYILFDRNMKMYQHGHAQISESGTLETLSLTDIEATKEGWIYVYLSNESNSLNEVYFDDMVVAIQESLVVQNTDYYPFGLQHNTSWTRPTDLKNNFLYNAGSELNEQTKNYETFFRQYDPALGRMTGIDPMAVKYSGVSPYNYAFNDPVGLNDPSGA